MLCHAAFSEDGIDQGLGYQAGEDVSKLTEDHKVLGVPFLAFVLRNHRPGKARNISTFLRGE
eukprot:scaffold3199_cov402-Prasinococcus_capsulatus_cf.AAC.9